MNSDTGQIYRTQEEIRAAQQRGEPLEPIGPRVAELDKALASIPVREYSPRRFSSAMMQMQMMGMSLPFPAPKPKPEPTERDARAMEAAELKRERKQQQRLARLKGAGR